MRRFAGKLKAKHRELADVMHSLPGEETQVDFFSGPPTFKPERGKYGRPWVFRMALSCSRLKRSEGDSNHWYVLMHIQLDIVEG